MPSALEIWYQLGFFFHAGAVTGLPNVLPSGAFWGTAMTSAAAAPVPRMLSGAPVLSALIIVLPAE